MKETPPPSKTSDKNPWSVMEDLSSSSDGSRRWPDWNTRESLKCEDTSEWPSWECSQGNTDIQKGDTMDTEVFASADSSFDEQRGRGILREISRDGGWNGSAKRHSEMSKRNSWHLTKDHSSSRNGSHRWPDCDALNSSKCEDDSGWPSWECFRESNDTRDVDTVDREVHTVSKYTFDEQRGQSKIRKRGRSRSRQREYSKSRSRSPCNGPRQASCRLSEKGSFSEKTSRRCRDFTAGKCSRGSQCRFLHQGYLNSRHRDHPRNDELTDRSKFRADGRGGTSQFCDYKGSASGPCDKISDNCEDYCEEVEIRKDAVCWKKPLEEKCFREESFRYSHHRSSGEEYDRRNERIVYDKNVKPLVKQNDIGHCKFLTVGRCHQNDCRFSHDVGRVTTGFLDAAKTKNCDDFGKGEDEIESEKCSAWDKFAGLSEKPKDTTGWGKWPGKSDNYICNSNSHDSLGGENTKLNRGEDEIKSQKCSAWDKFAAVSEKPKDTTGWGKWPGKPDNDIWNSNFHDSLRGENVRSNQKGVQHRTKPSGRREDEIKSKKCSAWDKFTSMPEKPKDTRWGKCPGKPDNYIWNSNSHASQSKRWDGRSEGNIYSQDLSEVKKQTDSNILHNSVRSGKRYDSGSNEKLSKRDKLMDLNLTVDGEKATGQGKDKTESWNGPTCDKDWSLDRPKAKVSVWGENVKKSENGLTWDKFAGVSKRPKDTTSRDNWPAWPDSSNANSNSHDPQNKTWDGRSRGNNYSQDLIDGKNHSDINILYNSVKKSSERADPGWKEKFPEREEIFQSHLRDGAANNTNMDLKMLAKKEKAKLSEWGENTKKSENGLAWDKFAGVSERRKDNTSWDNWPAWPDSSNGNSNSHDPQRKRRDCRSEGSINSQDLRDAKKQADDNIFYNAVKKSSERADPECNVKFSEREEFPQSHMRNDAANNTNISHSFVQKVIQNSSSEWNKKVTVRDANRLSPFLNEYNGAGSNTIKASDSVKLNDGKKSTNQGEDKKNSWNPKCDDSTCFLENKKASGWGGSRSSNDRHCHDPVDEEKPSQNNLVKTYCEMAISGQDNKVVVKDEYSPAHMLNGRDAILDESAKYKLSALANQMQKQFEEALKILETWACQNSITSDQALRLSKLQACLSENGVPVNSNEVLRKLKMEYLESSATIFKQEPVEYTELNHKTVMVEKVSGNNSKGEQCKKEEEIIQSVGADARCEAGESKQDEKSMWLFKNALVKLVKEILNPIWMEGQMKKEVHNTIVKKVVDKVISTEGINIPRTQEHAEQYLSFSKPQISALINDYVFTHNTSTLSVSLSLSLVSSCYFLTKQGVTGARRSYFRSTMMEETPPPNDISERSLCVRKDHSSPHAGHSFRWPEQDAFESLKCKDGSGWSSWECSQGYKDMHKIDTINREVLTVADSSLGKRSRVWKSGSRDRDSGLCWEKNSWERESSRRRGRDNSKSRSRSPCNGFKQASYRLIEKRRTLDVRHTRCRYFAAGKCFRGNQCKFLHHDYVKSRETDQPRIELTERLRFRAHDRGALQCDDYNGSADGPRDNICDSSSDYCEEDESRENTLCKDFPEGNCFRKQYHRYSPYKFAGEDGERVDKRAVYDQNDKTLANVSDMDPCKFFPAGFLAYCYINNLKVSRNDLTATDDTTRFSDNAKVAGWGQDTQKSLKAYEGLSETTNTTTSWDRLPASSVKHTVSHDPVSKRLDRSIGYNYCRVFTDVEKYDDGNSTHSFVHKGVENAVSGWNENVTIKDENRSSPLQNDYNDADTRIIEFSGSTMLNEGEKSTKQGENNKHSCNDPTYDDLACSLDDPEASGWGGRSANDRDCHDPIDAKKPSQNNLVKMNCEMATHGQDEKVVDEDKYLLSCTQNGSESADKDSCNPLATKNTVYRREHQIEVRGSEPGGFVLPPSSLSALATNPLNGYYTILDKSVKHKLSSLVNQMQIQFDEAIKILEMWARQNTATADLDVQLSKLHSYLSPISVNGQQKPPGDISGVQIKSNEVCEYENIEIENLESSDTLLKQHEPVGCAEVNENILIVKELNGNKGELCNQEVENTHPARVNAWSEAQGSSPDEKSMFLFRNALENLVKEILKPVLMQRQIKLEVHNAIVKKAVDKVISVDGVNIPKTQEHTDQFLSSSKPRISTLINDYVVYFKRLADSSG
ncbi:hypothetical protein POM88_003648 [Heracleum sosnowskyi]|uniref:C3H1-type domain-containing protein n=1 Tax=Heracleum sosnowskyi TaxID=360622 RepID=A0AAD8NDR1_9APIA|nr:hypothetical protein POM88_003648 [Heracleum sosnowskyi]